VSTYMASTHPANPDAADPADYLRRSAGAHRKPTRWTPVRAWLRQRGRR